MTGEMTNAQWKRLALFFVLRCTPVCRAVHGGPEDLELTAGLSIQAKTAIEQWSFENNAWEPITETNGLEQFLHLGVTDEFGGAENPARYRAVISTPFKTFVSPEFNYYTP